MSLVRKIGNHFKHRFGNGFSYLLLLHRLFVGLVHVVHLDAHVRFLVLEVSFDLCQLRGEQAIDQLS